MNVRACPAGPRATASEPRGPQARGPHQGRGRPAVSSARPACQAGDAAGRIVLIDTFLPAARAPRSARCLPSSPVPGKGPRLGCPLQTGDALPEACASSSRKRVAFNEAAGREVHRKLEEESSAQPDAEDRDGWRRQTGNRPRPRKESGRRGELCLQSHRKLPNCFPAW